MIKDILPLFVERKEALIILEKARNNGVKRRRFAVPCWPGLGRFALAYGAHLWQAWTATSAYDWCARTPLFHAIG